MEKGNQTSSSGFSDEERAQWGLPTLRVWEVTDPDEIVDPAEIAESDETTADLSEAADAPKTTAETADTPEMTAEAADAPETPAQTANASESTAETANAPEPPAETANASDAAAETADTPEPTAEAADAPETTAEATDTAEPSAQTVESETNGAADTAAEELAAEEIAAETGDPAEMAAEPEVWAEPADWTEPLPDIRAPLAEDMPPPSPSALAPPVPAVSTPVSDLPALSASASGDHAPPADGPPGPRPEPSWLQVLTSTVTLWTGRWARRLHAKVMPWPTGGRRLTQVVGLSVLALLAAVVVVLLTRGNTTRTAPSAQTGQASQGTQSRAGPVHTAQAVRAQAAGWILAQVTRATIVSCDPVMCAALQARGFPAGNLDVLRPGTADPLDSEVTVATSVLRSQFGTRLTSVYAPVTEASFGSGSASIQVRAVAPDGAPAYLRELSADLARRKSFGSQLAHNGHITAGPTARRQLEQGRVDARLIVVIGTVARSHQLRIVSFGDASPGASAEVPLRSVFLQPTTGGSPGRTVLSSVRSFLEGQQPPYLPAAVRIVRLQDGQYALNVQFAEPDPLGY